MRQQCALQRAVEAGDERKIEKRQGRLKEAYFTAQVKIKGELSSEERKRRRDRAAERRAAEKRRQVEAANEGQNTWKAVMVNSE
jgi:hypothetical protein